MRMGNERHDRLVAAMSKPTRKERDAAIADFDNDVRKVATDVKDLRVLWHNIAAAGSLRGGLGRQMGYVFITEFMPGLGASANAEDRFAATQSLVPVAFALAAYRADRGEYPADLAALVPKYVPAVSEDIFSGKPLHYKREGPGYVLYSVGQNGIDDGGRAAWDHQDDDDADAANCDDVAIRVPVKEEKKKDK
jgi:hypothetical protein